MCASSNFDECSRFADLIPIPIVYRFSFLNHDIDGKDVMRSFLYQLITWAYESQKQNRSFAENLLGRFRPFFFVFVLFIFSSFIYLYHFELFHP